MAADPSRPLAPEIERLRARIAELEARTADHARSERAARALADVSRELAGTLDPDVVGQRIVDHVRGLLGALASALFRPAGRADLVALAVAGDWGATGASALVVPAGTGLVGLAARDGTLLTTTDVLADPRVVLPAGARARVEGAGCRAILAVPLLARGRVIGVLAVADRQGRRFDEGEIELARSFGDRAALALSDAHLYAEATRRGREAEALAQTARLLTESLDEQDLADRIVRSVLELLGARSASIRRPRPDGSLVTLAWAGEAQGGFEPGHVLPPGVGLAARAVAEGRPVWTPDLLADSRITLSEDLRRWVAETGNRAALAVPLRVREAVVGVITLTRLGDRSFEEEIPLARAFADQAAVALENARLFAETRGRLAESETLLAVARALSRDLPVEEALRRVARELARALGADMVGAYFLDPRREVLFPIAGYHVPKHLLETFVTTSFPLTRFPFLREALETRRPIWTADYRNDPRFDQGFLGADRPRAALFAPTFVRGEIVGGLGLVWWTAGRRPTPAELRLLEGVAAQVGLALENAELSRRTREKLDELSVLYEVSRAVTGQLETAQLATAIHGQVGRVLDAANMVVFLHDEESGGFEVALRMREGAPDPNPVRRYPPGTGLMSAVVTARAPIRTADYAAACRAHGVQPTETGLRFRHWLGVPMAVGEHVLGVLVLRSTTHPFTESDERLLSNIGSLAALALRSARLYEERTQAYEERTRAYGELRATQDQLIRTEKLRALGEMAAGVAHDFNNLLAVILGRSELLLRAAREPDQARGLETIRQAALDGAQTVRRIQEFTRTRRIRPFGRVDVAEVVHQVIELTRPVWQDEAGSRGIRYEVRVEGGPVGPVAGRPEELREVFTNLLHNALEAMPAGGRLVFRVAEAGGSVVVSVTDTGAGMSEEVTRRVFEPFFTTKGPRGSGLGLSVAWGIVARHGGAIEVASRPGAGTTFTLRLPVDESAPVEPAPEPAPRPVRGAQVLVIDDEPAMRDVLRDLLTTEGYAVVEAGDGAAGVALCEAGPPGLVLSDVSMPGMSGWDVARACRARFPDLPVGLITGWGDQLDPAELERHRIRFVLAKPFEATDVLRRIAQTLAGVRAVG